TDATCSGAAVGGAMTGAPCYAIGGSVAAYARYPALAVTPGTCTIAPAIGKGASASPARVCMPPGSCVESLCLGTAPAGFASCLVQDGDVPCPAGPFVNRTLSGTRADVACAGCSGCTTSGTCSIPVGRAYSGGTCM